MVTKKKEKKVGRPSLYSAALVKKICEQLANGEGLTRICQQPGMPHVSTVMAWLIQHKEFSEAYVRAREAQGELMDQMILDAATAEPERVTISLGGGTAATKTQIDAGEIQHRRLKIDALKWRAAHLRPKVYGVQRQEVEHSGTVSLEQLLSAASKPEADK
jgi:hypothetical protein